MSEWWWWWERARQRDRNSPWGRGGREGQRPRRVAAGAIVLIPAMPVKRGHDRIGPVAKGTTKLEIGHFVVAGWREKESKTIEAEVLE